MFVHAVLLSKAGLALFASPDYFCGNQMGLSGLSLALEVQLHQQQGLQSSSSTLSCCILMCLANWP